VSRPHGLTSRSTMQPSAARATASARDRGQPPLTGFTAVYRPFNNSADRRLLVPSNDQKIASDFATAPSRLHVADAIHSSLIPPDHTLQSLLSWLSRPFSLLSIFMTFDKCYFKRLLKQPSFFKTKADISLPSYCAMSKNLQRSSLIMSLLFCS